MKKITVITSGWLPMPAVQGGAVENLIEIYLKRNEIDPRVEYTVFSIYNSDAQELAATYRYSHFEYIENKGCAFKLLNFYNKVLNKLWHLFKIQLPYQGDFFIRSVVDKIKKSGINYDCIIIENSPVYSVCVKKELKTRIVQHLHNDMICPSLYGADKILRSSDKIWTVSDFIKNRIGLVPELAEGNCKVNVLYNGIDTERFSTPIALQEKRELRERLNIGEADKILLFVGRIDSTKGVKELLLAFKKLSGFEDLKLLIVGSSFFSLAKKTPYIYELEEISKGMEGRILFTDYVDYAQIHKYYQLADITVLPSVWDDPFPLTCLEAMAAGCALIISDSGGMVEAVDKKSAVIVTRGDNFVSRLSDSIETLLMNDSLRREMREAAVLRAQKFTVGIYCRNYLDLLSEVIN